jgi:organic hydroperoxide reductase OsmC/OhrA
MADTATYRTTLHLRHGYEFVAAFPDVAGASPLVFDEPPPLGGGQAPNAVAVLGAAVGNCLAASFAFCLRRARVEVLDLAAHVTTHVVRDERGRLRIRAIEVELDPEIGSLREGAFDRCGELFEDFCTVTASVRRGIRVSVSMRGAGRPEAAGTANPTERPR